MNHAVLYAVTKLQLHCPVFGLLLLLLLLLLDAH